MHAAPPPNEPSAQRDEGGRALQSPSRAFPHHGNRVSSNTALLVVGLLSRVASNMSNLDPDSFTLRQVNAARDASAQVMDELDFVKAQLARLPTRQDLAFTRLRMMFCTALLSAGLVILWFEAFWRHCLSERVGAKSAT
jgi:hypothetical protein